MIENVLVSAKELQSTSTAALMKVGVPRESAETQVGLWLEAELRGHPSHGILRLPRMVERIKNGVASASATGLGSWRAAAHYDVDGQNGLGPVVARKAIAKISECARKTGIALSTVRNSNHLGMLAVYADEVASGGQILIALTTSEALVHPWGGRKAMLGTNPIAIGVPAKPHPFVLDMATSIVSMGKIHDLANHGEPLEEGWALDAEGNPTTDAIAAKAGAIAPFGMAKGYALGLAFEVLVAGLTASAFGKDVKGTLDSTEVCNKGDLFIVIEPSINSLADPITQYLDDLRATVPTNPSQPVQVPNDRARVSRELAMRQGVSIPVTIWSKIQSLSEPNVCNEDTKHVE